MDIIGYKIVNLEDGEVWTAESGKQIMGKDEALAEFHMVFDCIPGDWQIVDVQGENPNPVLRFSPTMAALWALTVSQPDSNTLEATLHTSREAAERAFVAFVGLNSLSYNAACEHLLSRDAGVSHKIELLEVS